MQIKFIDLCASDNNRDHHTDKFHISRKGRLIVRRCQRIKLLFQLDKSYPAEDLEVNTFYLLFIHAATETPSEMDSSVINVNVAGAEPESIPSLTTWQAFRNRSTEYDSIIVTLIVGANAAIGKWDLSAYLATPTTATSAFMVPDLYILFNPWSPGETVFLNDNNALEEYILADTGCIYTLLYPNIVPYPWTYGQFEKNILDSILFLLKGKLSTKELGDPIMFSRKLTEVVGSVIAGKWHLPYDDEPDSKSPLYWTESPEIILLSASSQKRPKYAQCFVFAGLCNTFCRALGLPCRVVTTFQSAIDRNNNLLVEWNDYEDNRIDPFEESIFNFHVWNEVWMKRPDIKKEGDFDGWQAIDSTMAEYTKEMPPEVKRVGPMSVKAVKRGDVDVPYDGFLLFSEVSADHVIWKYRKDKQVKLIKLPQNIGVDISTKGVMTNTRVDITAEYKHPEHTRLEREVFLKALRKTKDPMAKKYLTQTESCFITFVNKDCNSVLGQPIQALIQAKNEGSSKTCNLKGSITIDASQNDGRYIKELKFKKLDFQIKPGEVLEFKDEVPFAEYQDLLLTMVSFKLYLRVNVIEEDYDVYLMEYINVLGPEIKIDCDGNHEVGVPFKATLSFKNTLPVALTEGHFRVSSPGITKLSKVPISDTAPGYEAKCEIMLTGRAKGLRDLNAGFDSLQLQGIRGQKQINII